MVPALYYGERYEAGPGVSTVLAGMDFETYSEAGYVFREGRWKPLQKGKTGIGCVGAWVYSEHPSCEVLTFAYDLHDGTGEVVWTPDHQSPLELFEHMASGRLAEAVNSFFEYCIWTNVCRRRYGWPDLPLDQVRDVAAKAGAWTLPRKLQDVAAVLNTPTQKDTEGGKIMKRVSRPRTPTKHDDRQRYTRADSHGDFEKLDAYCVDDVRAEDQVSLRCADLSPHETAVFLTDQRINVRGVRCDREAVEASLCIIEQAEHRYHAELAEITGGVVRTSDELDNMKAWLRGVGVEAPSITKDTLPILLTQTMPPEAHRVLSIRAAMGSLSVKKTCAMSRQMSTDDRIRGLYTYAGAARTWRWAGSGVQPQNLPNAGPDVVRCAHCETVRWEGLGFCMSCFRSESRPAGWGIEAAEACLPALLTKSLDTVESLWGDALTAIAGCLRSFFIAAPGHELICSDYSAIEAVVLAELAGEDWRREVFRTHGRIYEMSAAKLFGMRFEEFAEHKARTGMHHPLRKKGKTAELASGYGGWIDTWRGHGAEGSDDEIATMAGRWREESPAIVDFWHGLEHSARRAIESPGECFGFRDIRYQTRGNVLYCQLPSGRAIPYHSPRVDDEIRYGKPNRALSYMGVNGKTKQWNRERMWGSMQAGHVTSATSRDIFAPALVRLEDAGYPIVLHTHDEPTAEVIAGYGSIEEFERIMVATDTWCADWPIRADGGWRGARYRKE